MSTRPRYYTGSAFAARPIIFVGVASYFWYRGGSRRDCSEDFPGEERFQYGRQCRKCSSWACPIGQHRESCTPQSDSYCKPCTNKPDGNYVYTTPGNANDCESTPCTTDEAIYLEQDIPLCDGVYSSDFDSAEFSADSAAEVVFYAEIPVDKDTFNSIGGEYKAAISEVSGATATVSQVETVAGSTFTRMVQEALAAPSSSRRLLQATNSTSVSSGTPTPSRSGPAECDVPLSKNEETVVVETVISTKVDQIDAVWAKLNEYDVNQKLRSACLPPAVIKYGDMVGASFGSRVAPSTLLVGFSVLVSIAMRA